MRMQTEEGENKWPNQYEASRKFSKNKDKVLKQAMPLILV